MTALAIVGATVIDGTGRPPMEDSVLLCERDRIVNVFRRSEAALPEGATLVPAYGRTLIPGLVDVHDHVAVVPTNHVLMARLREGRANTGT